MDSPTTTLPPIVIGMPQPVTEPVGISQSDSKEQRASIEVYHWKEVQSLCSRLHPNMLAEGGVVKLVNGRLKGQAPMGDYRVPPKYRPVKHDIDYCVYRLKTILKHFDRHQAKMVFDRYLERENQRFVGSERYHQNQTLISNRSLQSDGSL